MHHTLNTHQSDKARPSPSSARLLTEFVFIFVVMPIPFCFVDAIRPFLIPTLMGVAAGCFSVLRRDTDFPRGNLWNRKGAVRALPSISLSVLVAGAAMTVFVFYLDREFLLFLPRRKPLLWVMIMFFYPVLSVYPQEVIYRAFLFHRYRSLFPSAWSRILASTIAFGFVHIVFLHPVSVLLSLVAGAFFAVTYARSRSLAAVWLQHALFGALVFTLGMGKYFYHGTVKVAEFVTEGL